MGSHFNDDGEFQSDKYPTCPPGKVPLSVKDKTAQDLLWEYAQRRRRVDSEFADDLEAALKAKGYNPTRAYEEKRPEFLEMIAAAKRKEFEMVITFPESLGETFEEVMISLRLLQKAGVPVAFAPNTRPS